MPKIPTYTLAWSSTRQAYELYETHDRGVLKIAPDSPAWFAWLDQIPSFAFFGKTTLLAQWIAEAGMPVAWLSLEPEDNDPTRFLSYLIAALQTLDSQLGATALVMLNIPQPAPPEIVLAALTNDLASRDAEDFALVLDDY